ncbi:MAG: hypothetical protein QOD67_5042 [Caballeronia sp.]|jgi:hypothetical protein|nr:hypothetical protein [Caballeronia sp.]
MAGVNAECQQGFVAQLLHALSLKYNANNPKCRLLTEQQ